MQRRGENFDNLINQCSSLVINAASEDDLVLLKRLVKLNEILAKETSNIVAAWSNSGAGLQSSPSVEYGSAKIRDKVYKTVTIGNQVWMADNLAIDDGDERIYHNPDNNETYYTWDAAIRVAKSIPGWHLPSAQEWNEAALACGATEKPWEENRDLNDYEDARVLKDKLGVKLAGNRHLRSFYDVGSYAYFWTATEYSSTFAYNRYFSSGASMDSNYSYKTNNAYSVRLVKDPA